ncbi:MAG TPA: TetR/AcrR family transcriptional regulator [Anaeromyxobacteraceae bacterium]|nr:TetR/AcrR family transcriptional regulator [Anaeromyxobacteraceae bacterium]
MTPPRPTDSPGPQEPLPSLENEPEKRRAILHAAVRVFAEKGYQGCRIADVAKQAGVAYGLVYHYFRNKEELLESVFSEQWSIFIQSIGAIADGPGTAPEQLAAVCRFSIDVYRTAPAAVRVLLLEVARTPNSLRVGSTRQTFVTALGLVAEMVRRGQAAGELRSDVDPGVAAAAMLGALELTLTGMIVGAIGGADATGEEAVERAKRSIVDLVLGGLLPKAD